MGSNEAPGLQRHDSARLPPVAGHSETLAVNTPHLSHADLLEHDVVVCGGGPAGCAAAIAAARNGARTLLVEKEGCLGGATVSQLVGVVLSTNEVDFGGIWHEWARRLEQHGGIGTARKCPSPLYTGVEWYRNSVDPERVKQVWDELLVEAGAEVLHFTTVIGAMKEGTEITGLECFCRGHRFRLDCRLLIDATGNGDVAHLAGCDWHRGVEGKLWPQAVSLNALSVRAGGCDPGAGGTLGHRPERLWRKDRKRVDPLEPKALTEAVRSLRRDIWTTNAKGRLLWTAPDLGVRTSRIIKGMDTVSDDDAWQLRKREDSVARASWELDVHPPDDEPLNPRMFHSRSAEYAERAQRVAAGDWFDVPYGSIVARDADNLLLGGRIVSSGYLAQGSLRIQQTCMATGQASGAAAALSLKAGTTPRELDPMTIVAQLAKDRDVDRVFGRPS